MNLKTVSYQKIFPTGMMYLNHKIGVEIELSPDDNPDDAFQLAKQTVERWNIESNPGMAAAIAYSEPELPLIPKKNGKEAATDNMITAINSCTELKVLETFRLLVKNNPVFQEAYDKKLKQLQ